MAEANCLGVALVPWPVLLVGADLGQPFSTKERAQLHGAIVPDGVAGGTVFGVADTAGVDEGD